MANGNRDGGGGPYMAAYRALADNFGQLGVQLVGPGTGDVHKFTVRQRAPYDWVAVITRWTAAGAREVAFGNGHDCVGALLGLAGSIQADRWQPDKFFDPSDGDS